MVSSQRLIPLPLIHDAKKWIKEITATDEDINLQEIFKELKEDHAGHVPMDKFKHRVINYRSIKYRGWLTYLQLALTIFGVIVIAYKAASICVSFIFPLIRRLLPVPICRRSDRVRQYRIVCQPRQNIELRQRNSSICTTSIIESLNIPVSISPQLCFQIILFYIFILP